MSEAIQELNKSNFFTGKKILELGGGIGNHTIRILKNNPELLVTTEINEDRLQVTRQAVQNHFGNTINCEFSVADWLAIEGSYDVVITNPPFFMSGKYNRRFFIDELILNSYKRLKSEGKLIFVQSSMADITKSKMRMEENGYHQFEIIKQQCYPWREYYYSDLKFIEMCDKNPNSHFMKDGERWEVLYVVRGKLKEFNTKFIH
ncbi:MAG: class I SAM-dependent methyltransferase [Candidatus Hodarchaeales archaeon]